MMIIIIMIVIMLHHRRWYKTSEMELGRTYLNLFLFFSLSWLRRDDEISHVRVYKYRCLSFQLPLQRKESKTKTKTNANTTTSTAMILQTMYGISLA